MSAFAYVLTDIVHQNIDRVFTYRVPAELEGQLSVGMRVIVPFGRQRAIEGYVLALSDECSLAPEKIKPIERVMEDYSVLLPEQITLAQWMKTKYHSMTAQVIRLMLPAQMRKNRVREKSVAYVRLLADQADADSYFSQIRYGTKQYKILEFLLENGSCDKSELTLAYGAVDDPLKKLAASGAVALERRELNRSPYQQLTPEKTDWLALKEEQENALREILDAVNNQTGNILLHGITGSGKTEVYMRAIKQVLDAGGTAIMLIPEISLTPQTVGRFRERFADSVAVLHSALSAGERYDEWRRIRMGEARVVVGARSAIFAPCQNLKLVIIDEAHEGSYVAGNHPAYNAVEVAEKLMEIHGGTLVLGSATPSVEQYYAAKQGRYTIVHMLNRINGKPLPEIEVVDMATELAEGNRSLFSKRLYQEMEKAIQSGNQLILFLNRRGHSTVVTCRACGKTVQCKNCDISMTYHLSEINSRYGANRLRCHYCGSEADYPKVCPSCGSKYIKFMGAGTEKVEEECHKLFPGVGVLRMDNDTTRGKDAHLHILSQFSAGNAQILIGTQMIAKGLDFPKVSLVGIVSADTMLQLPDYTSREKTYSLITQVAGRAGRADLPGTVVLQTYTPKHYAIADAITYDYEDFFTRDIAQRQSGMYPPFARILRLVFLSEDAEEARRACYAFFQDLRQKVGEAPGYLQTVLYMNMATAPIGKIKGQYRHQILLKMRANAHANGIEDIFFKEYEAFRSNSVYLEAEVNPTNLF